MLSTEYLVQPSVRGPPFHSYNTPHPGIVSNPIIVLTRWCVSNTRIKSLLKLTLLVILVGAAIFGMLAADIGNETARAFFASIRAFLASIDPILARLLYVLFYIAGTVLLLPGLLLSFVGALLFGVWEGTLYTWIGATIGATLAFGLARALGRDFVDHLLGSKLAALDEWLREHGLMGLLIIRLVPLFPFNGVNFGCGLTSIRLRDYVLATAIGIVPATFVYQYLFATLGEKALAEGFAWRDLATIEVLLPIGAFVVFVLVGGWMAGKMRGKQTASSADERPLR